MDSGRVIEFQDAAHQRLMHAIAARLGFDIVSLRLELFGRRRDQASEAKDPPRRGARRRPATRDRAATDQASRDQAGIEQAGTGRTDATG